MDWEKCTVSLFLNSFEENSMNLAIDIMHHCD